MPKANDLEAAVKRAVVELRAELPSTPESDALVERFESIIPLIPFSARETFVTAQQACYALQDCAHECENADEGDTADELGHIDRRLATVLRGWYDKAHEAERDSRRFWHDKDISDSPVARWESRGGKHWVELWHGPYDYHYVSCNGGGSVCSPHAPLEGAVTVMTAMLARGMFLPDSAKLPMKQVR